MFDFNGGKLYHVFETESEGRDLRYIDKFLSDEAKEAFTKGVGILKVDGECSAIHKEDEKWKFYVRRDNFKGQGKILPLPEGKQLDTYDQGGKPHHYRFLYLSPEFTTGKGHRKSDVGKEIYACIAKGVEEGNLPNPSDSDAPEWITCELVGTKHQTNMDGVPCEHALVPHYYPFLPHVQVTSFEHFVDMAKTVCIEGVVFQHPTTRTRFKLRFNMMEQNMWSTTKKPQDAGVTDIRPRVLTPNGLLKWTDGEWVNLDS